jgi:hypothetical protein
MSTVVNLFLDLIELEIVSVKGIVDILLDCLQSYGMTGNYLKTHLVCVACDCATIMMSIKSGVTKLMKENFPSLIVWQCSCHRLELSVAETVKSVTGISKFKQWLINFLSCSMRHQQKTESMPKLVGH